MISSSFAFSCMFQELNSCIFDPHGCGKRTLLMQYMLQCYWRFCRQLLDEYRHAALLQLL